MSFQLYNEPLSPRGREQAASVRLCCLGSDECFLHTLLTNSDGLFMIESRRYPFDEEFFDNSISEEPFGEPVRIETELPDYLQESLRIDPALEIFAVGRPPVRDPLGEIDPQSPGCQPKAFSNLCVYSRKSVFVLALAYHVVSQESPTTGSVLCIVEPFQRHLSGNQFSWSSMHIVRVRPAPTHASGHAILSPPGSLAMLAYNSESQLHSLTLYHAGLVADSEPLLSPNPEQCLTIPLEFAMEELADSPQDGSASRIVDFCFAASKELALFSSLTVLLLKGSGDVLSASPVLFHGTVIKAQVLNEALEYLMCQREAATPRSPKWNQCRVATRYLADAFSSTDKANFYLANLCMNAPPSVSFPLQVQGPLFFASSQAAGTPLLTLEPFGNADVIGIACGMQQGQVDFLVISPTATLPRFALESKDDSYALDDAMVRLSAVVERVALGIDIGASHGRGSHCLMSLWRDPIVDTLLHVCTNGNVSTISTNAVHLASRRILARATDEAVRTLAWPCILGANLVGSVVTGDSDAGHDLIARLGDGQLVRVNVSEAQVRHELRMTNTDPSKSRPALLEAPDSALSALESTPPFYEVISPLLKQIEKGLAGLTQIVGSKTNAEDITPEQLAIAIQLQERCTKELVLPLLELKKATEARQTKLELLLASQRQQLADLSQSVASLKEQASSIAQSLDTASSNASVLSERAASLLQASKDLVPTVTDAEMAFFQDIKRLETKCKLVEKDLHIALATKASLKDGPMKVEISAATADNVKVLLDYSGVALSLVRREIEDTENKLHGTLGQ